MNRRTSACAFPLLCILAACGADDPAPVDNDGTPDSGVTDDAESNSDAAVEEDGVADVDATPEPDPEVCDDGVDNDGDGFADCTDEDCVSDAACPQRETCGDGADNDLDGDTDCDDDDCCGTIACGSGCGPGESCQDDPSLCTGDQVCNTAGECIDPVTIDSYVPAEDWSYVASIFVPDMRDEEVACCFDLDGDGLLDNGLGETLSPIAPTLLSGDSLNVALASFIEEEDVSIVVEYRELPEGGTGPGSFHFWFGEATGDAAGLEGYDTRAAGEATYRVNDDAFADEIGSFIQMNQLEFTEFVGRQRNTKFAITIDASDLLDGLGLLSITIRGATFEATLDATDPRFSVNTEFDGFTVGGARLGGFIQLDELLSQLDAAFRPCDCAAELDGSSPVIVYGDDSGPNYAASCSQNNYDVSECTVEEDGELCVELLNELCGYIPILGSIPGLADIDSNGNGVGDALSVGVFLQMVSATVDPDDWIAIDTE